jgi:hypothetical protein
MLILILIAASDLILILFNYLRKLQLPITDVLFAKLQVKRLLVVAKVTGRTYIIFFRI